MSNFIRRPKKEWEKLIKKKESGFTLEELEKACKNSSGYIGNTGNRSIAYGGVPCYVELGINEES